MIILSYIFTHNNITAEEVLSSILEKIKDMSINKMF